MTSFQKKMQVLFVPFIMLLLSFITIYSILNWWLFLRIDTFPLKSEWRNIYLPFLLALLVAVLWMSLVKNKLVLKNERGWTGIVFFATIMIASPACLLQGYLGEATGKLTQLNKISDYEQHSPTLFYRIRQYYIDKRDIGKAVTFVRAGRFGTRLAVHYYISIPLLETQADTSKDACDYFVGKEYQTEFSAGFSPAEKQRLTEAFIRKSIMQFDTSRFSDINFFEKVDYSNTLDGYKRALLNCRFVRYKDPVIFMAISRAYSERIRLKPLWVGTAVTGSILIWFLLISLLPIKPELLG